MVYLTDRHGIVSDENSTNTPLNASSVFTGQGVQQVRISDQSISTYSAKSINPTNQQTQPNDCIRAEF